MGQVLHVVVFGVEMDGRTTRAGEGQHRPQASDRVVEPFVCGERPEAGRQGRWFHGDVDARQRAPGVAFEHIARAPPRGVVDQEVGELEEPARVPVGFAVRDDLLTEQVDGGCFAVVPQAGQAWQRARRRGTGDELPRHPQDAAPRHHRGDGRAER